ncbi:HAD-like protein [Rhizodiscina lignyota]|uniref:HAD-like protein n=1 Tax=Rhizodiscina lignyota TaxID=1504668 RepID=A0A9P4I7Y0_9PEZI|nr:HAD-like protein [Rhizodiscina lignyota]
MTQVPPSQSPTHFKFCSFDIYGTLIDWEGGIANALLTSAPIASLPDSHKLKTRAYILETYEREERKLQQEQPGLEYSKLLAEVYRRVLKAEGIEITPDVEKTSDDFAHSIGTWPAFPDTVKAMQTLGKYYKLAPLSNVDNASFSRTLSGPLKDVNFSAIYTAQDIGSYKPDPRNFEYLVSHVEKDFGIKKDEIWHIAQSLHHDHVPTTEGGFETGVWVDRKGAMGEVSGELKERAKYGWRVGSLGELADIVEEAWAKEGKQP